VLRSQRVIAGLLRFFQSDIAGGVVLTAAAAVALAWANSPWKASYFRIWDHSAHLSGRAFSDFSTVQSWVNGGLMALFFLVVGLEIARERRVGELADTRTAVVPVVGALGGMVGAALVYALVNHGGPGARGWGIPMATDIAFALGALALLGRRVPPGLRLLLLTLAVADDLGSVSVLAIFYSARTWLPGLVGAVVVTAALVAIRRRWPTSAWPILVGGVALWLFLSSAGIEPALAGVVVGLLVPGGATAAGGPAGRLEYVLAPVSAYVVLPLFALANAGITLGSSVFHHRGATAVFGGIVVARVVGKLVGITVACAVVVRLGWGRLPDGLRWVHVAGGAAVAGIGFTVPLLIAEQAFATDAALVTASELGLLVGSVAALAVGMGILQLAWRADRRRTRSRPNR
jgi:NhaA family Na+:H+ antiporter